jgi:hypothetical protein
MVRSELASEGLPLMVEKRLELRFYSESSQHQGLFRCSQFCDERGNQVEDGAREGGKGGRRNAHRV